MSSNTNPGLIQYQILKRFDSIRHFTTTRLGGVSVGNYSSFNLGLFTSDLPENISQNFDLLGSLTGIDKNTIHLPFQTHSNRIFQIGENFPGQHDETKKSLLHGIDALITDIPGQCIGVSTADCVPILLYDPVCKAIGAVHAGWRGTCSGIVTKTLTKMISAFQSDPANLIAVLGPSISPDVYEVGAPLMDEFREAGFETKEIFSEKKGRIFLDLWKANKLLLTHVGVKEENIEISGKCTYGQHENFFSARRLGISSGRMISGIMLI